MFRKYGQYIKSHLSAGRIFRIVIWIMTAAICVPFLWAARYAIFKADDFADYNYCMVEEGSSWFIKGLNACASTYMGWQGTWSTNFIRIIFNPLQGFSYRLLRLILMGTVLASLIGIVLMMLMTMKYLGIKRRNAVYFVALLLIPLLSVRDYKEIYLWYNGATIYLLPVFFFSVGFSFLLAGEIRKKKTFYLLSAVFMVLMTGGVLEFTGFGMFWLLLFLIVDYLRTSRFNGWSLAVFFTSLLGALANALAPGNFARKSADGGEIEILNAVFSTVRVPFEEAEWLYKDTAFPAFVLVAFLLGCCLKRKGSSVKTTICILGLALTPFVTIFPVSLGYGEISAETLPGRCLFLLDAAIIAGSIGIAVLAGNRLFAQGRLPDMKNIRFVVCMGIMLVLTSQGGRLAESAPVAVTANLIDGTIHEYASAWRGVFDEIRDSEDSDVAILEGPKETAGCLSPGMRDDPQWWVNRNVAKFFGKESVRIIRENE